MFRKCQSVKISQLFLLRSCVLAYSQHEVFMLTIRTSKSEFEYNLKTYFNMYQTCYIHITSITVEDFVSRCHQHHSILFDRFSFCLRLVPVSHPQDEWVQRERVCVGYCSWLQDSRLASFFYVSMLVIPEALAPAHKQSLFVR